MARKPVKSNIDEYVDMLTEMGKFWYPLTVKNTLNDMAFKTMNEARTKTLPDSMNLKNKYTARTVRWKKATTLKMVDMKAEVGSNEDYMKKQELGGIVFGVNGGNVAIPTKFASGESQGTGAESSSKAKKLARPMNRVQNIKLSPTRKRKGNRKQRNAININKAKKTGRKFVLLTLADARRGLFRLTGGRKNPKLKMVADVSNPSVTIKKNPWLLPAVNKVLEKQDEIFENQLRHRIQQIHKKWPSLRG